MITKKDKLTVSHETISEYNLAVCQPRHGYRYNMDPFFLVKFVKLPEETTRIIDLGTGVGIIPLLLARLHPSINEIAGIEIQESLAELAKYNVKQNNFREQIKIIHGNFYLEKNRLPPCSWHMVISNPPYYLLHQGRLNICRQKAIARHEITTNLEELLETANYFLKPGGDFYLIYPAERTADLLTTCIHNNLTPKRMQCLHSRPDQPAERIMLQARKNGNPGLEIQAPLFVYP